MDILNLCSRVPFPPKDGGTIGVWTLIENLEKIGDKITVFALNTNKHYIDVENVKDQLPENVELIAWAINTDLKWNLALKNLLFSKLPYNSERFFNAEYNQRLKELLEKKHFDIVQIESPNMGFYIPTIRKYSKAKIVARTANVENEIWQRVANAEKNTIKRIYYKILAKRMRQLEISVLQNSDAFLSVTPKDLSYFLEKLEGKKHIASAVIPTGVNAETIVNSIEEKELTDFFFIGALDWIPNQEGVIWFLDNVWKEFVEKNPKKYFHIAGRYAPKSFVSLLEKYKNVVYHGEIPDANTFMRQYPVMIVPLLSGSGMRVKIIEAMANGALVISTSIGAEGIGAKNNENIFLADSGEEFIDIMTKLSENKELIDKIRTEALELVKSDFSNEQIAYKLHNFFENLINK